MPADHGCKPERSYDMIREIEVKAVNGLAVLMVLIPTQLGISYLIFFAIRSLALHGPSWLRLLTLAVAVLLWVTDLLLLTGGLFTVAPNEAKVLQLFGKYVGTVHLPGLRWANPFYTKTALSLRVRNFETGKLKVNDKRGNPIEFADRKSTRLNSSHVVISYAVFCLKKKNKRNKYIDLYLTT